ncbi:MAG: hypothetical protein HZA93_11290 [Verrucomicrobia bacterium]|nr:hypothetical protein [Verrucomicrobiota bacterium]
MVSTVTFAAQPGGDLTLARAEALYAKLPKADPWNDRPDGSVLAWGESHTLHALVDMFEATEEVKYLEEVARRGDRLLTHRDDRSGVKDGSGHSRPAWSMGLKYVVADGRVIDAAGRVLVALRSCPAAYNDETGIEVVPGTGGRFSLKISNAHYGRTEQFDDLSLEPGDARFVEKAVNAPKFTVSPRRGHFTTHSDLLRVTVLAAGVPQAQQLTLRPITLAYMGYAGVIYHPMLRFAEQVKARPQLAALAPAAARFVQAAEETYADASRRLWRDGPGEGEGYYLCCERGESFPYDNIGEPFNYLGRHTAAQLALHRLTGKAEYRVRAEKMARLFKNRLTLDAARDLYVWNYWYEPVTTTGWTRANSPSFNIPEFPKTARVEDTSHGVLDIALVTQAQRAGVVFDERDLRRFAQTLLQNVLTPPRDGINVRVDGTGGPHPEYFGALGGWLELAEANPEVYRAIRRTIETTKTFDFRTMAAVLKWEKKLAGR